MIPGFQTYSDPNGNLWVADGYVAQLRSGVRLPIGSGEEMPPLLMPPDGSRFIPVPAATTGTFVGGSGRNLVTTGLTPSLSGPALPVGIWQPQRPDVWTLGSNTLTKTGASAANIHDGTATVASLTTGSAPVGDYVATTHGEDTYNGGTAFTLAAAAEEGSPGTIPDHILSVSAGTAVPGYYVADDAANYHAEDDADFTIVVNSDGTADLFYLTTVIATRADGPPTEPGGIYEATAAGETACNSGEPWRAFVRMIPRPARAGFVYVKLTETAAILTNAEGPYFATALPSDTATEFHIPIAQSDGLGALVQLHTGLLLWDAGPSAAPLAGVKTYYVSDTSGGATTRKLTFTDGILTAET